MKIIQKAAPAKPKALIGAHGLVELQYTGRSEGVITWWGPVTGQQYKAGRDRPRIFVDSRDADLALAQWKEKDVSVFIRAPQRAKPKPATLPQVVTPDDIPVEDNADTTEAADVEDVVEEAPPEQSGNGAPATPPQEIDATAGAVELAAQFGINLAELYRGERITKRDIERYIETRTGDTGNVSPRGTD